MALPEYSMRQLLEAGVHFGHHTRRWNPKMRHYIFGVRNGIHILDLQQTSPMLGTALKAMRDIVAKGGRVLFVGTKRQAQEPIAEAARRSGQYFVNHRWLGGMLTNWKTISISINRLRELDELLSGDIAGYTKKEILMMTRERDKLLLSIGGIKDMGGQPDALFIIDTTKEDIAIKEANKLGIPVFAIVDSNAPLDGVDYIIPGNDDSLRAIDLYCELFTAAILDGLQVELEQSGRDIGSNSDASVTLQESGGKKGKKSKGSPKDSVDAAAPADEQVAENAESANKKAASA